MSVAVRLSQGVQRRGGLCVGIDPHAHLLAEWGLPDDARGARDFGLRVVDAAAGRVAVVKPQVAFFERFGPDGFTALAEVIARARDAGLIVIADAKRGDIGSTHAGYLDAWLAPGAPFESDALTVSPFLGMDALTDALTATRAWGKALFVLAATSNPHAALVQAATTDAGDTVARAIEAHVIRALDDGVIEQGSVGLVVGATLGERVHALGLQFDARVPILAPGFGAQGGRLANARALIPSAGVVLAAVSRSVLGDGPDGLARAIDTAREELA